MVAYYRLKDVSQLKDLGFRLSEGIQVIAPEAIAPVSEATQLLEDARAQALAIVRNAEEVREAERQRGYEEGLAQGQMQSVELMLHQSADLDRRIEALEQDLTNILMVSMRKLVDGFDDATKAEAIVRGALKQMRREKKAEIRVSPEQLAYFRKAVTRILLDFPGFDLLEVVEDASLSAPHVVVETSVGRIEGDLGSRLTEFDNIIRGMLPGAVPDEDIVLAVNGDAEDAELHAKDDALTDPSELDDVEDWDEEENWDEDEEDYEDDDEEADDDER
ncbi:type III secretion system stator protein SctL [Pseudochelatococcus sp. G4_1912]|uniref:type III secretion system stator protein SctL n=1 Tax=Pseudochelatococcus sp. G4_1912 TaxID=3114288 RepID=UPI0039C73371